MISVEQYNQIDSLLNSGNRTGAYILAANLTGREAFYFGAQVSRFTGFVGSTALAQNIFIRNDRIAESGLPESEVYSAGGIIGLELRGHNT